MASAVAASGKSSKRKGRPKLWLRKRERQDLWLQSLQMDVHDIKQQIESLTVLRSILYARVLNDQDEFDGAFVKTARQYFDMMHDGYHDALRPKNYSELVNGREFLSSIMDPKVRTGPLVGVDQFIDMVTRHNAAMDESGLVFLRARLVSIPSDPSESPEQRNQVMVIADARFESRTTPEVVDLVYPTLETDPHKQSLFRGQEMSTRGQLRFTFDVATRRVVQFDVVLDVVDATFRVVEDPRVLTEMTKNALLTPNVHVQELSSVSRFTPVTDAEAADDEKGVVDPERDPAEANRMSVDFLLAPAGA